MANNLSSIITFKNANKLIRSHDYYSALLILRYLRDYGPKLKIYADNYAYAENKYIYSSGGAKPIVRLKAEGKNRFQIKILDRLFDTQNGEFSLSKEDLIELDDEEACLLAAKYYKDLDVEFYWKCLNNWIKSYDLASFENILSPSFENFNFKRSSSVYGSGTVTIAMSAFNAEKTVAKSIESLLNQTYCDLEIILIDDFSSDLTYSIFKKYEKIDKRIRIYRNDKNCGTYNNRNFALYHSTGKFFTVMDADDISHPSRIESQIKLLSGRTNLVASLSDWVRFTIDGSPVYKNGYSGGYKHESLVSLFFNKSKVIDKIGFYDSVRFGADSEYYERIKKVFGPGSVLRVEKPLIIALFAESSLTGNKVTGVSNESGVSLTRSRYRNSWENWHKSDSNLYLPFRQSERVFEAPSEMIAKVL